MKKNRLKQAGILATILFVFNSCSDSSEEDVDPCQNGPEISISSLKNSLEGQDDGEIVAESTSGTQPYMYSLNGSDFQGSDTFTGLAPDTYTVTVKDNNGCTDNISATISEVQIVSYAASIRPIIDTNCQVAGCHGSNPNIPSWETYDDVKNGAAFIKARTGNGTMPPMNPLDDSDVKLIADWVDLGAQDN